MARWHICNILKAAGTPQLWQFSATGADYKPVRDFLPAPEEPLPGRVVDQTWESLWQKKLNVAWLPPGMAFLRVIQIPVAEPEEMLAMVEFQLEKISPLPVQQIVWSMELLQEKVGGQQTVVVTIAIRQQVENYLGQLEGRGYIADRLEVPLLDNLLAIDSKPEGVWVFAPQDGVSHAWLIAWRQGGVWRNLSIINLPDADNREALLAAQLQQLAWSAELEGWIPEAPQWHLVADTVMAAIYEPAVRQFAGHCEVVTPPPASRLANLCASRAAAHGRAPGLLPQDFLERYHARFVDRLWLSGLGTLMGTYLVFTLLYFGFLEVLKFRQQRAESKVASLSVAYTNAMQVKAQITILEEQEKLKYAALEGWEATAKFLPEELTLTSLSFSRSRILTLFGTAPQDLSSKITEFNATLKDAEVEGKPLFSKINAPSLSARQGGTVIWSFTCEMNRLETE